ncbi:retron system putative HNH endonuclease [Chromobacterium haemolyticum]|nr:retron system putative HNH endonuclease [Chromobacterium haemolyticum]
MISEEKKLRMKKISKSDCPESLNFYLESNPDEKWETFKDEEREGFKDVQKTIRNDQGGICAYCENKMEIFHGKGKDDFRIEHFHPKKRPPLPPPNWGLDWNNLLGVCTGGSERYVGNTSLFTAPDFSCDVPKQ